MAHKDIPKRKTDNVGKKGTENSMMLDVNFQTGMSEFIPRRGVLQYDDMLVRLSVKVPLV